MAWITLSIMIALATALGAGGNFGDTQGLNGAGTQTTIKAPNPVQHRE